MEQNTWIEYSYHFIGVTFFLAGVIIIYLISRNKRNENSWWLYFLIGPLPLLFDSLPKDPQERKKVKSRVKIGIIIMITIVMVDIIFNRS